jgi:NAD(P)-dependent dehydrogenase (short-subunit alcohol dehydrogenase family)
MKILLLGASKNVGYYCALRLLSQKHTCIFLLRKTSVFDADKEIQKYLAEGRVKLVKGDGLIHDDVRNLWKVALEDGVAVDYVIFTLGGIPGMCQLQIFM